MEKRRDIKNIYVPPDFQVIWDEFVKICAREGESVSAKIREYVARYVAIHSKGNPQLQLTRFILGINSKCFRCEGMFPSLLTVRFISGLKAQLCRDCLKRDIERGLIKKILIA